MRVIVEKDAIADVRRAISEGVRADYVYAYPPRQAYATSDVTTSDIRTLVSASLAQSSQLNVYTHFPFCAQICSFCNLYSTAATASSPIDAYIDSLIAEISSKTAIIHGKELRSVYLGGGTPSLLSPQQLERVLQAIGGAVGQPAIGRDVEVALEVDPATVDRDKLVDFRRVGINRINLGYQSTHEDEIHRIGRQSVAARGVCLIAEAMSVGFANVCVDLIYGLEGQSLSSWREAVRQVIELRPNTICAYCLTPRPFTSYWRRGYRGLNGANTYARYVAANELLTEAGYAQETPVRWVIGGGGYQQKRNHWGMENILGFGAGARSYLWEVDTRNGYSVRRRQRPLSVYMRSASSGCVTPSDGYLMNDDERRRKAVILGIIDLDRRWFRALLGGDPIDAFSEEFAFLEASGLVTVSDARIALTATGMQYRDIVAQLFFSQEVRSRLKAFDYDE